jgi:hypothetical protein
MQQPMRAYGVLLKNPNATSPLALRFIGARVRKHQLVSLRGDYFGVIGEAITRFG